MWNPFSFLYLIGFVLTLVVSVRLWLGLPAGPFRSSLVTLMALLSAWNLVDFLSNQAKTSLDLWTLAVVFTPIWSTVPIAMVRAAMAYEGQQSWLTHPAGWLIAVLPASGFGWLIATHRLYVDFTPAGPWQPFSAHATQLHFLVVVYMGLALALTMAVLLLGERDDPSAAKTRRIFLAGLVPVGIVALIFNGGANQLGLHPPMLASSVLSAFGLYISLGVVRRDILTPAQHLADRFAQAATQLSGRNRVLDALPTGVAVIDEGDRAPFYCNAAWRQMTGSTGVTDSLSLSAGAAPQPWPSDPERRLILRPTPLRWEGRACMLVLLHDATDAHDLALREQQLIHAQRLETLGMLTLGVAHDLNNLLHVIQGNASLVREALPEEGLLREDTEEILATTRRAQRLSAQLLALGRPKARSAITELASALQDIKPLLRHLTGPEVQVVVSASAGLQVRLGIGQIEQVLVNLAVNANDAMPRGGKLEITAEQQGDHVLLLVSDTGLGMPPEVVARVLEPFYTTKGAAGNGLGLALVAELVSEAGGSLALSSEVGHGTEVRILLPIPTGLASALN